MSAIFYKDNPYGGTTTVTDAGHVLVTEGSDTTTAQAKFNTQTTAIQRILGNFATVEQSTTASKAYNVGDYLVLNSFLYKVTQVIAAGDTIDNTQNGNVVKTTAGKEFGNGGGGGSSVIELTQAQYDALSEEEKMDDIIYLIKDSPDNYLDEVFGDFASVEYTNTASKAYSVGDYLIYDSKFYRVTSAIALGGTITPNTNVVQTTVGDEIKFNNLYFNGTLKPRKTYDVTTNAAMVTALNNMCENINIDKGISVYSLRTIDSTETTPWVPKGNWVCLAYRLTVDSFFACVFMFSYGYPDIYMYRNANGVANERYITKLSGTDTQRW